MHRILHEAKKRGSGPLGCLNDQQMRRMAGQPAKTPNPLDHYRPIELCRWCEAPEVNDAVTALGFELVGTKAARRTHRRQRITHLRIALLNLYHHRYALHGAYTAYSRDSMAYDSLVARYNPRGVTRRLVKVVDGLAELGYIEHVKGFDDRRSGGASRLSRMRANPSLIELLDKHGVTVAMSAETPDRQVIVLRDAEGVDSDYVETPKTTGMREVVTAYNDQIAEAQITLDLTGKQLADLGHSQPDLTNKSTRRIFNSPDLRRGGRLYGPWWVKAPKEARRAIRINGNATIECDYSAQHIHLLYCLENRNYNELFDDGDPYSLPGHCPEHRAPLKLALLVALNAESEAQALPAIRNEWRDKLGREQYDGLDPRDLIYAFAHKHAAIAKHLFTGVGLKLQNMDSQITEYVLKEMMERGIVALNIHDSFIVEVEHREVLVAQMIQAFHHLGWPSIPGIK